MANYDDLGEGRDLEAERIRREQRPRPPYDPLFAPWDPPDEAAPGESHDALSSADVSFETDDLFWDTPSDVVFEADRLSADIPAAYPDRTQPAYEQRLAELQRRLRDQTVTVPRSEHRWTVTARELVETLLLALLIFMAVRASFQNFRVEGSSMQPSLENGEYLIVNKLAYASIDFGFLNWLPFIDADEPTDLWGNPERGDVIVFRAPTNPNRDFIKRIIGMPGDTVAIDSSTGAVRVNGDLLDEPYIQGRTTCTGRCEHFEIPERDTRDSFAECGSDACYFVMGDNRQNSSDSRIGWLVPEENIIGKTLITYWQDGSPDFNLAPNHSVDFVDEAAASE
ncbi:MAG: signal peptidase I [Chloroflexi bacterium]|nr:signal peptidase I [Chloroflexota bacterium]